MFINSFNEPNIIYFAGNSSFEVDSGNGRVAEHGIDLGLVVDTNSSMVLDMYVTLPSPLGRDFIGSQIIGLRLENDLENIVKSLQRYQAPAQEAVIAALNDAYRRYRNYLEYEKAN